MRYVKPLAPVAGRETAFYRLAGRSLPGEGNCKLGRFTSASGSPSTESLTGTSAAYVCFVLESTVESGLATGALRRYRFAEAGDRAIRSYGARRGTISSRPLTKPAV